LATAEVASEALFAQTGMIRVDTLEDLFDAANLLSHQPVPSGRKVAILTNGGGPGIMTADACADRGLELPDLSDKTISEMSKFLPVRASITNPIDMTAEATAEQYGKALKLLADDDNVNIVIVIFIPPVVTDSASVATVIRETAPVFRSKSKTLVASFMGSRGAHIDLGSTEGGYVPSYAFPESTATVLASACDYNDWLSKPKGKIPSFKDIQKEKAKALIKAVLKRERVRPLWLDHLSVIELFYLYGINSVPVRTAVKAAESLGFPVVVKLHSTSITHKTEVGGVLLDLRSPKEVNNAFTKIKKQLSDLGRENEMAGVSIQPMISKGVEVIVGMTEDPSFGPLVMFGMGGVQAELFRDVTFRIHPLTDVDAHEMICSVKAHQLLTGWRGSKMTDIPSLENLLLRVSAMIEDLPQIMELDLNPIKVLEQNKGYVVVDARIMLR
jgi:acetyltransferase